MADSFIIVISIILIIQLITLSSFAHFRPVVKAGNVSKFYWKYKLMFGKRPKAILCDNVRVDVSSYETLYVYGNSMKDYHIYNGQEVFVDKLNERQKETISDYPVLVFRIHDMKLQSAYKLRKFVGYVDNPDNADWKELYQQFRERIKINEDLFVSECQRKQEKLDNPSERHILSETYDENTDTYRYSMHPVSSLYAKAMYAVAV